MKSFSFAVHFHLEHQLDSMAHQRPILVNAGWSRQAVMLEPNASQAPSAIQFVAPCEGKLGTVGAKRWKVLSEATIRL